MSSSDLRKYEYFIGKGLGYKPIVIEQAKFGYSLLCNIFNKEFQFLKEGLFKWLENIKVKNKELLKAIKDQRIKQSESEKTETTNDLIYDPNHSFCKYRMSNFSQISSVASKFDTLEMFYREFTRLKFLDEISLLC